MKGLPSFNIKVHQNFYIIKPYKNNGGTLYEIYTNCEKLFTLKKDLDGNWVTLEEDVIPITNELTYDIGEVLEEYEKSVQHHT